MKQDKKWKVKCVIEKLMMFIFEFLMHILSEELLLMNKHKRFVHMDKEQRLIKIVKNYNEWMLNFQVGKR
jgi:hypothetical protein